MFFDIRIRVYLDDFKHLAGKSNVVKEAKDVISTLKQQLQDDKLVLSLTVGGKEGKNNI